MKSSVNSRKKISIFTAVLFTVTGASGVLLLLAHPGHGQNASSAFIISKHIHEIAAIPFLLFAAVHIYYNGKTLLNYFTKS